MAQHLTLNILSSLPTAELLNIKLKDLPLTIKGTIYQRAQDQLSKELAAQGLKFRPGVYISTEWFCGDGSNNFALPFYLLHPRLTTLAKTFGLAVEGDTLNEAMKIFRHEAGHAIDNAFNLRKKKTRQKLFGLSCTPYPESYLMHPQRGDCVRHFPEGYAQSHPDEDWAETFAVWLTPQSKWRKVYAGTEALTKILYVDATMQSLQNLRPKKSADSCPYSLVNSHQTLGEFFESSRLYNLRIQKRLARTSLRLSLIRLKTRHLPRDLSNVSKRPTKRLSHNEWVILPM